MLLFGHPRIRWANPANSLAITVAVVSGPPTEASSDGSM